MTSTSLTGRQQLELHKALVQYLTPIIAPDGAAASTEDTELLGALYRRLGIDESDFANNLSKTIPDDYLAKKWTAVLRLQKKILELENTVQQYKESGAGVGVGASSRDSWIPQRVGKTLKNYGSCSVTSCSIHPFEPLVALGTSDGMIVVWDLMSLVEPVRVLKNAHTKNVNCVRFSPCEVALNGGAKQVLLASCSSDLVVKVWDAKFQPIRSLTGHDHLVSSVAWHPTKDTHLVSCSRDCAIKIWDLSSGWCVKTFVGHSDWVRKIDLCGEYVLSCSNDQSVRLSHLDSGTGIGLMIGHGQVVENCKFFTSPASTALLDRICLKFLFHGNEADFKVLPHSTYEQVGYKYCATCGRDDKIKIWLLPLPQLRPHRAPLPSLNPNGSLVLTLSHHSSWVRDLQIHPNGKYLISCSDDKTIKVWDLGNDLKCVETLAKHEAFVNCIAFAPPISDDSGVGYRNHFVSGGVDTTIVWS